MSASVADPPKPKRKPARPPSWAEVVRQGGHVVLHDSNWDLYERFDAYFMEHGGGRVSYCDGILEIMPISTPHEIAKRVIGRLIEDYALSVGLEFQSHGQATISDPVKNAAKEPDDSFWFGREPEEGAPADLIVEVVVTSAAIDKLSFHARFGVPELWIWEDGKIEVFLLNQGSGSYAKSDRSALFPNLEMGLLELCSTIAPLSQAIREFREVLK